MCPCRRRGASAARPRPRARGGLRFRAARLRSCPLDRLSSMTLPAVRKAIFPAAGLGTRFLPVTKAQPKEMLPLVDKPTIQYGVEEAIASGIEQVIMVTGGGKRAIVDHFDRSLELEHYLEERGRSDLLHILAEVEALGRYVILPAVFDELEKGQPGAGKEIQLVDAIKRTIGSQPVVGIEFEGDYYDTGTVPGYLRANLTLAMKREGLREELVPLLQELLEASAEGSAPRGL